MWNLYSKCGISIVSVLLVYGSVNAKDSTLTKNNLNKVYYHQAAFALQEKNAAERSIEFGSLVCYFSATPIINSLSQEKKQGELIFFFPKASIASSEVRAAIKKLSALERVPYKLRIEEVATPTQGIKLWVSFDPTKVSMKYDIFDSIGSQKGVVFRFFNQQTLKELSHKCCRPVLNVASAKKPSRIVVDCGHGGSDTGAIGALGISEKEVTLNIGIELARLLKREGFEVILTRTKDKDMPLDDRTTLANKQKGDFLVSIHANSAPSKKAEGIETFWMDNQLLTSIDVVMDNACKSVACMVETERSRSSKALADVVHKHLIGAVSKEFVVVDRSVKKSVSQMLLGPAMPSILVEVGFLSHDHESQRLSQRNYQSLLAHGICSGIKSYAQSIAA